MSNDRRRKAAAADFTELRVRVVLCRAFAQFGKCAANKSYMSGIEHKSDCI